MRNIPAIFGLTILMLVPAGTAVADESCFVPMSGWQPRAAVEKFATEKGWRISRIKIDDGCYEIKGQDALGKPMEVTLHPGTLTVMRVEAGEQEDD